MKRLFLSLLALSALCGCTSEDDASAVILFVTPSTDEAGCSEMIYYDVEARTRNERIETFRIESYDTRSGNQALYAAQPQSRSYTYRFYYRVPDIAAGPLDLQLTFRVTDNLGNSREQRLSLRISGNTALLPQTSGITLYSPHSGKPDGFSLSTARPLLCAATPPEETDLYIYTDPEAAPEALSREWRTMTDVRFSRANDFNYAGATKASLSAVYANFERYSFIKDIVVGDIILIGRLTEVWGVVQVVGIFDEEGSVNDRYLLNLKTME